MIAGEVLIGSREMRTMGIEAAYPVRESAARRPAAAKSATRSLRRPLDGWPAPGVGDAAHAASSLDGSASPLD